MASRVISAILTLKDKDFSSNIARAAARSDDLGRGVSYIGNKIQSFGRTASTAFRNVATAAAGVSFAGIAAGAAALTAGVVGSVMEMDSAFGRLEARTGATGTKLEGLKSVAKDVFRAGFGENISQVADDVSVLRGQFKDFSTNELSGLAKDVYTVTESFDQDFNEVSRTVAVLTKNFKDLDASTALDGITYGFQNGLNYSDELLDTLREYAPQFNDMGISFESMLSVLEAGTNAGAWNLDKVGDAIKESHLRMGALDKATVEAYESMGFNADEYVGKINKGGEVGNKAFQEIVAALMEVEDATERNQLATDLFGTQYEDLQEKVIFAMAEATTATADFEGATGRAANALRNKFSSRVTTAWRDLKLGIAEVVQDSGGKEFMDSLATGAEGLVPKIKSLVEKAFEFGNTIRDNWTPIKETIITIGTAVGTFVTIMGGLKVISFISTLIQGFRTAMSLATAGQWAMNTAMLASPLTWIAAGLALVVAGGVLLYRNWDTIKTKADELWTKTKEVFGNIFEWAKEKLSPVIGFFKGLYDKFIDFKNAITSFKMPKWVSSVGNTISTAFGKVKGILPSFDVGTNRVASDMTANIHKGEMIIPARQAERLRQQGVNIDNIDKVVDGKSSGGNTMTTTTTVTNSNTSAKNNVNVNIYSNGTTTAQVIKEIVPQLKLVLANL